MYILLNLKHLLNPYDTKDSDTLTIPSQSNTASANPKAPATDITMNIPIPAMPLGPNYTSYI